MSAKLVLTSADRGCHVVSVTDPFGRILGLHVHACSAPTERDKRWLHVPLVLPVHESGHNCLCVVSCHRFKGKWLLGELLESVILSVTICDWIVVKLSPGLYVNTWVPGYGHYFPCWNTSSIGDSAVEYFVSWSYWLNCVRILPEIQDVCNETPWFNRTRCLQRNALILSYRVSTMKRPSLSYRMSTMKRPNFNVQGVYNETAYFIVQDDYNESPWFYRAGCL
jgi:hypothetical protein